MVRPGFVKFYLVIVTLVSTIALLVLAGWLFNLKFILHPLKGMVATNPVTAISLLLAVASILFYVRSRPHKRFLIWSKVLAVMVIIAGALKLFETISGNPTGYDTFLFSDKLSSDIINGFPNTLSPYTAVCLVLFGLSVISLSFTNIKRINFAHGFSLINLFLSLLYIISYVYDVDSFFGNVSFIPMALYTSVAVFLLSTLILFIHGDKGFMGEVTSPYKGGKAARILLPAAVILPVFLGVLRLHAEEWNVITHYYGTALFTVANIIILVFVIWKGAAAINSWNRKMEAEITERIKSDEHIRATNVFLDTILENMPDMVFVKDAKDLKFMRVNRETERVLGLSREEFLGKTDYDFFPAEQADEFVKKDREVFEAGKPFDVPEEKVTTYNGDRWLHTTKIPIYDDSKQPLYMIGISEDITARKNNEEKIRNFYKDLELKVQQRTEELSRSEMRFRALIDNAVDVISMADENGEIKFLSPPIEKITGFQAEEKLGKNGFDYLHPEDFESMQILYDNMLQKKGATSPFSTRLKHKNGGYVWIEGNITNLLHDENVKAMVFNYHDITERRLAEERLKKYYEEVKRSNKELEQFAYIASHDLQEPLRMVSSFLQLLEKRYEHLFDDTAKKYIHFALDGSERMKKLILDLLAYSRVGAGKEVFTQVNLNEVMQELLVVFKPQLDLDGGQIIYEKLPVVRAIRSQMVQLFQNLLSNALKYQSPGVPPSVEISCSEEHRHWLFKVKDNGIGIESRFYDKLFVLFQRLHDKKEYSGTGIGLAICKKIVEAHGGIIWVESEPGKGSTFIFMLRKN